MACWYAAFFAWNPSSRSSFHQHSTSSTWQKPIWWRPSLAGQHTLSGKLSGFWLGSNHRHLWLLGSFGILHRLSTFLFCRFLLFFWMVFFSPPASKKAFMSTSYFAWASWNFFWYTAFFLFTQSWKHFSPANLVMAVTRWPCWLLGLGQWVHLFEKEEHEAKLSGLKRLEAVKVSMQQIVKQLQESFFLHLIPLCINIRCNAQRQPHTWPFSLFGLPWLWPDGSFRHASFHTNSNWFWELHALAQSDSPLRARTVNGHGQGKELKSLPSPQKKKHLQNLYSLSDKNQYISGSSRCNTSTSTSKIDAPNAWSTKCPAGVLCDFLHFILSTINNSLHWKYTD